MASRWWQRRRSAVALAVIVSVLGLPAAASAHGPVDPAASSYLARLDPAPAGVRARVIDGDQRLWLTAGPARAVIVIDYEGAPYLRFSAAGVAVNRASEMYYSNQVPAEIPPPGTGPHTRPVWISVGTGHSYEWHDGRLHALAATAPAPGASDLGRWRIPLQIDGRAAALTGDLLYAPSPSIVWFWPILVVALCVLAGVRQRRPRLDARLARALAGAGLVAFTVAGFAQQLHGRPDVSVGQELTLVVMLGFVAWAAVRLTRRRLGWFTVFVIAAAAIWEGVSLVGVLTDGFVLLALPGLVDRVAVIACLSCGVALLPLVFAMAERGGRPGLGAGPPAVALVVVAVAIAGCGTTVRSGRGVTVTGAGAGAAIPSQLARESRPIGRGVRFAPSARGPVLGPCRRRLGPRIGVHVEAFAADRVVLVAAGIGARAPVRRLEGRIVAAACFGTLVTLEPTGVVLIAPGARFTLADLFRSWGRTLSAHRLLGFAGRVRTYVAGRQVTGPPGQVRLAAHGEIVLEVGPHVPPHAAYHFPPGA